jgi:hypothetical protein
MIRRLVIPLAFVFLVGCTSSGEDYQLAAEVGKQLGATGVVPLDTQGADKTHSGKIVYVGPGVNGSPHFTYYEVTDPKDMQKLKAAAEVAAKEIPAVRKITLHFMEKQVFHQQLDGSGYRGREKEIETIVVRREP